ncbi:MAG: membrane protein of unknown function [Promethearchaeota archaeon]|nr:MAG: membrane protein of unknown function [Candidatus Lokiarchaeota archaeon]
MSILEQIVATISEKIRISKNFRIFYISSYAVIMVIFLVGSFLVQLPILFLISIYAITVSTLAVFNDHWFLNSLSIPFTFVYLFAFIQDLLSLNLLFASFHIITVISCFLILKRKNKSLLLMLFVSCLYAFWILAIKTWLYFPYYECILMVCGNLNQFIVVLITFLTTSIITSYDKIYFKIQKKGIKPMETEIITS